MIEKKPIRKDRVAIAVIFLLAVILLPILLRSGGKSPAPITVVEEPSVSTPTTTVTAPPSTEQQPEISPATSETTSPQEEQPTTEPTSTTTSTSQKALRILSYTVAAGDTLSSIADKLGISVYALMADNQIISPQSLKPGEVLHAVKDGILHLVKSGQTLTDISITYSVPVEKIVAANEISDPSKIYAGEEIIIPGVKPDLWKEVIKLSKGVKSRFIWPALGKVTSGFGWRIHPVYKVRHFHNGIDIDIPVGTIVHAAAPGKVYFVGTEKGYGNIVILQHADGYYTLYGHLSKPLVYTGQFVEAGQAIAESGNTGVSSGPHLHFEIRHGDFPVDPARYLP